MPRPRRAKSPSRLHLGRKRGVFGTIKRELRGRSSIEPIIGHLMAEGHLDAANFILSAVGYNFRRILTWLRVFWSLILTALTAVISSSPALKTGFLMDD